tara:strand:+ start:206 stop:376 length:171 start_codon:yes stop_codon:yes gene_type:complete
MRGGGGISGIKMNKRHKDRKRLKKWLEGKKKRAIARKKQMEEDKKRYPRIWKRLRY